MLTLRTARRPKMRQQVFGQRLLRHGENCLMQTLESGLSLMYLPAVNRVKRKISYYHGLTNNDAYFQNKHGRTKLLNPKHNSLNIGTFPADELKA